MNSSSLCVFMKQNCKTFKIRIIILRLFIFKFKWAILQNEKVCIVNTDRFNLMSPFKYWKGKNHIATAECQLLKKPFSQIYLINVAIGVEPVVKIQPIPEMKF